MARTKKYLMLCGSAILCCMLVMIYEDWSKNYDWRLQIKTDRHDGENQSSSLHGNFQIEENDQKATEQPVETLTSAPADSNFATCQEEINLLKQHFEESRNHDISVFYGAMKSVQGERQGMLNQQCRYAGRQGGIVYANYEQDTTSGNHPTIYYSSNYNVMFCEVAKVGCTQFKLSLLEMENVVPNPYALEHESIHARTYGKKTMLRNEKNITKVKEMFDTYLKVMIVRDPFDRLVSAYNDKLAPRKDFSHPKYTPISLRIREKYHPGNTSQDHASFHNFVDFLLDQNAKGKRLDLHWNLFMKSCQPCQYNYDYIAKLETIEKDARYLEQLLGLHKDWGNEKPITLFHGASDNEMKAKTSREKVIKAFSNVPINKSKKLYEMYKQDFEFFGYPYPHDILG